MDTGGSKGGMKADINVTPLVDIVLVLLIIFIVITPAVNNAVQLPLARRAEKPDFSPGVKELTLVIDAQHDAKLQQLVPKSVLIDDPTNQDKTGFPLYDTNGNPDEAARANLKKFVTANVAYNPLRRVFVKAHAGLPFKYVNELFQLCRDAGATEASIVTSEEKASDQNS